MADIPELPETTTPPVPGEGETRRCPAEKAEKNRLLDWLTALFPVLVIAVIYYGWTAVLLTLPAMAGYLLVAALLKPLVPLPCRALPALVIGLLIAFCMPVGAPLWVSPIAGALAALTAALSGEIGRRFPDSAYARPLAHPVLLAVGIVCLVFSGVLMAAPPTQWTATNAPTGAPALAGLWDSTAAVPLERLFFGLQAGAIGQTCTPVLLLAGVYAGLRRRLRLIAPACMLTTVTLLSWLVWGKPLYGLLVGGVLFGALLLADNAFAPAHYGVQAAVGILAGGLTVLLRAVFLIDGTFWAVFVACMLVPFLPAMGRQIARFSRWAWVYIARFGRFVGRHVMRFFRWIGARGKEILEKLQKSEKNS